MEQSASTQTQPFQNRTHLGWIKRTQSESSNNNRWSVSTPKNCQALHRSEIWEWSSTPAWLWRLTSPSWQEHASTSCKEFDRRKKNLDEDAVKTLVHACTCPLTPGLLQLGTGQLARSNACAAHSCPAFCCTAYSKSPETGFRIAGNDGAPLAPTPSSNNIQIVYIDARHPHYGHYPKYMKKMVLPLSTTLPGRQRLRSAATQNYDIRRVKLKFGERAFAVAAPKAWNSLPNSLKQINDTVKFRKYLKTHLFNLAYIQLTDILCHFRSSVERDWSKRWWWV